MTEKPKRLTPTSETLRELFLKSGNLCAFPSCTHLMMDADGTFIGQVCHIEAAEEGGERFNPNMTNEQRRGFPNLLLLCYPHHQKTNDVSLFPVSTLQKLKADHEQRFSRPDRAILERLTDWTDVDAPSEVKNLRRLSRILGWENTHEELEICATDLNEYVAMLRNVPVEVRRFAGSVSKRMMKMEKTAVVQIGVSGRKIVISDLSKAFQIGPHSIAEKANELDFYGLGNLDEMDSDLGPQSAVRIRDMKSGWRIWHDIVCFCEAASEPLEAFTDDLDFCRFDE